MITLRNGGSELSLLPFRGANTCSWKLNGEDLLWADPESLKSTSPKFGGGNPIMFPIFSTLKLNGESSLRYDGKNVQLPQHGLARLCSHWRPNLVRDDQVIFYLDSNAETEAVFPWAFGLRFIYTLGKTSLTLEQEVTNPGPTPLPFVIGFHPYFKVSDPANAEFIGHIPGRPCIRLDPEGEHDLNDHLPHRLPFGKERVDHHFTEHLPVATLRDRVLGRSFKIEASPEYRAMTVFSEPNKPFVCVEPITGRRGAFETRENLIRLAPGKIWRGKVHISVQG